jgi:hypothetical protein
MYKVMSSHTFTVFTFLFAPSFTLKSLTKRTMDLSLIWAGNGPITKCDLLRSLCIMYCALYKVNAESTVSDTRVSKQICLATIINTHEHASTCNMYERMSVHFLISQNLLMRTPPAELQK